MKKGGIHLNTLNYTPYHSRRTRIASIEDAVINRLSAIELIFAHGYLPADGQQHKTVVEITGHLLDDEYRTIVAHFERLRRKRNIFFYDSTDISSATEAKTAIDTAKRLVEIIKAVTENLDPQQRITL